jgi:hypothetical protein
MADKKKTGNHKKVIKDLSKNYWAISTIILAILLVITIISGSFGSAIGKNAAGQKVLEFANGQGADATLVEVNEDGAFYEVVLSIDGQQFPVYVTKDGEKFTSQLIELEAQPQDPSTNSPSAPVEVPKSNKPIVEAFVMSHCPYGTQIEKGLIPVMNLLGDKIDAEIKFVYYAMHPSQGEVEEQLNQYCIQKEQNPLFLEYLTCFLEAGDGVGCLASTGVDTAKLETCTTAADTEFNVIANLEDQSGWLNGRFPLFDIHKAENDAYGVGGSPTLVINGKQAQAGRDSQSLLNAICGAFIEAPEECSEDLSSLGNPSPGFGFGTQGGATAAGCGV